jgi:glycosyltransferase involved in cell wall biosynthesis
MPEMRIGIDCRFAGTNSGLGRYTRELTAALQKRNDGIEYVLFGNDNAPFPHYSLREQTSFPGIIKKSGVDLFFAPHFNVPLLCPVPFVTTIHDLILHRYPNQASSTKRLAYRAVMRHTVRKAQSLIAVSQFTADELTSVYGKDVKKKISVIHEAVSDEFIKKSAAACSPTLNRFGLKKPFFLYVGNAKQHKNVQMLIDAYRSLSSLYEQHRSQQHQSSSFSTLH